MPAAFVDAANDPGPRAPQTEIAGAEIRNGDQQNEIDTGWSENDCDESAGVSNAENADRGSEIGARRAVAPGTRAT
ncbi:hypothetical protein PC120_g4266 [Phytophthora cactorum]|nr:hypothetical protein PC120_g4266 [Phytophthora cactorum]